MNNLIGMILSIGFVFLVIIISEVLKRTINLDIETTRKFIHIGVSHWWLIAMVLIPDIKYAVVPPLVFIVLNYISYRKNLFGSMERKEGTSDLGTVYFPIALMILVLFTWNESILKQEAKYIGAIGILIMGYGDGFASLVGKKLGRLKFKIFRNKKSIEGSIAMFIFSFLITLIVLFWANGFSLTNVYITFTIAAAATFIEAITPLGLDNLTVPILSSLLGYYLIINSYNNELINLFYRTSLGLLFSSIIAFLAYKKNSLSISGAIGAIILGTGIFATSGIYGAAIMIMFFLSSSFLSHYKKVRKENVAKQFDKTGKRDFFQVFANGGVGVILSIVYFITQNPQFLIALAISFAAANADTWSTELGTLNKSRPFSLRTFKRVIKGTSGAVSFLGTVSGFLGSIFIGIVAIALMFILDLSIYNQSYLKIFIYITLGGFIGGLIDSILGATIQGIYYFDQEKIETEKKVYNNVPTRLIRGFSFINNDIVNFLSISIPSFMIMFLLK